jgi:hypothetical protein
VGWRESRGDGRFVGKLKEKVIELKDYLVE